MDGFHILRNFGRCQADFWRASSNDVAGVEPTGRVAGEFNDSSLPFVRYLSSPTHAYYLDLRQNPGAGEAGQLLSHGNGNITGTQDIHNPGAILTREGTTGTYADASGGTALGRVTLALNTLLGVRNYVAYLVDSSRIELIVMDPNRVRARSRTQDRLAVRRYRSSER